ncbi:ATP-binding protein [Brevibacillus sp. SYSU BS000544]|uniref:ATP-binding protein n=1 Tax=Brevibacillus sp. SYSU BS000544 TaxID=3416443 RepID=UPI003CE497A6
MEEITLSFHGMEDLPHIRCSVSKFLHKNVQTDYLLMELAIIEALNNAVQHGNKNCSHSFMQIRMRLSRKNTLFIRIKDHGDGFPGNFLLKKLRESSIDPYEEILFNESGRGLLLMNSVTDCLFYNQHGNEVLLIKRFTAKKSTCH